MADGSGTPVDVAANRTDPGAIGLAAGVAEFELADPVVAIQGSATASAPHLVIALDTRGSAGVTVRLTLRDIDATANDAVEPVAVQYRVGDPGLRACPAATSPTPPSGRARGDEGNRRARGAARGGRRAPLVEVRVITTDAAGRDEWVGVDDIEVTAASAGGGTGTCPGRAPFPCRALAPGRGPGPAPGPIPGPHRPRSCHRSSAIWSSRHPPSRRRGGARR